MAATRRNSDSGRMDPSTVMYDGHRWFLDTGQIAPPRLLSGWRPQRSKSSRSATTTTTPQQQQHYKGPAYQRHTLQTCRTELYSLHWVPGGQKISFKARRWSGAHRRQRAESTQRPCSLTPTGTSSGWSRSRPRRRFRSLWTATCGQC